MELLQSFTEFESINTTNATSGVQGNYYKPKHRFSNTIIIYIPDSSDPAALFPGISTGLLTFASISCILFILVGVPGNLITIIALARCKKVRKILKPFLS